MLEVFLLGATDIISILLIIQFINMMYRKSYKPTAYLYLESQLEFFASSSVVYVIVLYAYVYLENIFRIDERYTDGIVLILFFFVSGTVGNLIYKNWFRYKKRISYIPSKAEHLFIAIVVCIAVSVKMVSEGMINATVPLVWILGRFIWLDTSSIKEIRESLNVQYKRIVESAILFTFGMFFLAILMRFFDFQRIFQVLFSVLYGIIILYPYKKIRYMMSNSEKVQIGK